MKSNDIFLDQLTTCRQKLLVTQAIKCGLKHEVVKLNKEGQSIKLGHPDVTSYERLGFCSAELRHNNITCAHTQSRYTLREALIALKNVDPDSTKKYNTLEKHLNVLENTIHQLDISKGDEEKALAILRDEGRETGKLANIESEIEDIKSLHNASVEAMDMLKNEVIKSIDLVLIKRSQ